MSFFSGLKDKAFQASAKAYLNQKISNFGTVTDLSIDSKSKSLQLELQLKGEAAPIRVHVARYELTRENQRPLVAVHEVSASREWITTALKEYIVGRRFEIPGAVWSAL